MTVRFLQVFFALAGIVQITTGLVTVFGGADTIAGADSANESLENELRFYSVFWSALGCVSLWLVPRVETHTLAVRAVLAAIFAGGIARVISIITVGTPHTLALVLMSIELIVPPIVAVVQARIAK